MHIPSALLVVDNYLKETPKFGIETAAKGGNGVVNGEIVDKTRSFLTGTESKAEERQRPAREETEREISERTVRTVGQREKETKEKKRALVRHPLGWTRRMRAIPYRWHTVFPCLYGYLLVLSSLLLFLISSISSIQPLFFQISFSFFFSMRFFVLFSPFLSIYLFCTFFFEIFKPERRKIQG